MADTRRGSDAKTTTKRRSSLSTAVIGAVDDLVTAAQSPAAPVSKKARRKMKKLGKQLDAVRATEAKRLRQSAKARQEAARRDRQAADAAARMASIVSTMRDTAGGSIAKQRAGTAPAAKSPALKPAKSAGGKTTRSKPATAAARPAAAARAKPAAAAKPSGGTKPAGARKAATTAKAATRRRTTATPAPKPARRTVTTTRTPKPKPTA